MVLSTFCLLFAAWFGFYHSRAQHNVYVFINQKNLHKTLTSYLPTAMMIQGVFICILHSDVGRGIAIWATLLVVSGTVFMFAWQLFPKIVDRFMPISLVLGITYGLVELINGL